MQPESPDPVVEFFDRYGLANTSGEKHGRRKVALAEARMAHAAERDGLVDGARLEYEQAVEARRLLGYLWTATGKNHLRPVNDLFAEDDPIREDIERLAIFPEPSDD